MDIKKIKQLADVLVKHDLSALEIREDNDYLLLKRQSGDVAPELHVGSTKRTITPSRARSEPSAFNPEEVYSEDSSYPSETDTATNPIGQPDLSAEPKQNIHYIESPMVGIFYRSGEPGSDPFVEMGSEIEPGDDICIIEAMKMMNQIKSDVKGKVVEILVENGQPVEYGQRLFGISVN